MIRRTHHGGNFRHRHAKLLLGQNGEDIIALQRKGNAQLFQHDIVIHPALNRQRWGRLIFAALVVDQAVKEDRQHNVRAALEALFVLLFQPRYQLLCADDGIAQRKNAHQVVIIGFQGVAQAT